MSHAMKTGAARSLVVLSAAVASLVFAPHSQAQQLTKPLSSIAAATQSAKVTCHGITNVPMTADAEQTIPLRLVTYVPCGQEVSVLSDFEAYTVAVRTPEGLSGYVARMYLAAPSKAPSRQAGAGASAEVKAGVASWQAGAPGCDQFSSEDGTVESMTVNGVTVQVSLQDTGWKFRTNVAVANNGSQSVHVVPARFLLDVVRPGLHPLAYQNPDHITSAATHQIYSTAAAAGPSIQDVSFRQPAGGGNSHNYFAAVVTQGSFNGNPYAETVQEYNAEALREATVSPSSALAGAVWFERSRHAEQVLLRVPVNDVVFEFPLSFNREK
jgi:hypothetical protein